MLKKITILFVLAASIISLNLSGISGCGSSSPTPEATGGSGGGDAGSGGSGGVSGSGGSGGSAGSNADLSALSLSKGSLSPTFDANTTSYTASVNFLTQSIQLTPTLSDTSATMTVNGASLASGVTSSAITLTPGSNTLTVAVTGQDTTTTKTYTITLTRESVSDFAQQAYVKASNTGDGDIFGFPVSLYGDTLAVGAPNEDSNSTTIGSLGTDDGSANDSGAVYIFTRSGIAWTQQAYIKASNTGAGDKFGISVSLYGDTLAVGAPNEDSNSTTIGSLGTDDGSANDSGAVYIFTRSGIAWTQQAYIKASNTGAGDKFGISVSLYGDTLAVGAYNEDSNSTTIGNLGTDDGSANNSGAVYVFTRSSGVWSQQTYLKPSNTGANDNFGYSVSLYGDTLAVGAYNEDSNSTTIGSLGTDDGSANNSGAVYVFTRSSGVWSQQTYLKPSNTGANDNFGYSVSLYGDTLAVGAYNEDSNSTTIGSLGTDDGSANNSGAVYVFTRSSGVWSQQTYLKPSNTGANDNFGYSVSLYGDTLAVGASAEDSNSTTINTGSADDSALNAGAAYIFTRNESVWTQQSYIKASNAASDSYFGVSVSLYGDTLAVGAYVADYPTSNGGAVYVFSRSGTSWTQQAQVIASNSESNDFFGYSIALYEDSIATGAYNEDSNSTTIDSGSSDNSASNAGAVYIFQ